MRDNLFAPLAMRLRPQVLSEFVGQTHLLGEGKPLRSAIEKGVLHSMILWGPPGTGKTTLAYLLAENAKAEIEKLSAVLAGVKEIRDVLDRAEFRRQQHHHATVLFVDEIHRFNKSQQDAFLPAVESGLITLIGATTENPAFALNNALLSRTRVYVLKTLNLEDLKMLLTRALVDKDRGLGRESLSIAAEIQDILISAADGDARQMLNILEMAADLATDHIIDRATLQSVIGQTLRRFDKGGDYFYELISALHKAIRGSDPDASLYWLARLLDGGGDPLYVARRLMRVASEDIGNADPRALEVTLNAWQAVERLGSPEGELALAQAVVYLAVAAKSNAVYTAFKAAVQDVKHSGSLPVPPHICNAPTKLMKQMGIGKAYRYAHDEPHAYAAGENYFPAGHNPLQYYYPTDRGLEKQIQEKLNFLNQLDLMHAKNKKSG